MGLKWKVCRRFNGDPMARVAIVGAASTELGALEMLKSYASRECVSVEWSKDGRRFRGLTYTNAVSLDYTYVEAWIECHGEKGE